MSRIREKFGQVKRSDKKGFIPFITAGDPDLETTYNLILKLADLDSTVIELGVPFTDPMADGPVIQLSSQRALKNGEITIAKILDLVSAIRKKTDVPIVLFGYLNPFLQYGIRKLRDDAKQSGADGFLITDVIGKEFSEISASFAESDIDLISLVTPTTTDERLAAIARSARGFIYAVSRAGVTGTRNDLSSTAMALVRRTRKFSDLPVAVGFGVSTNEHVRKVWKYADAAVVGSAIVDRIHGSRNSPDLVGEIGDFVSGLTE
ncbi:MAG: tryptophan synthase subunit alpha [Pyrinomonadaceae bacterium]